MTRTATVSVDNTSTASKHAPRASVVARQITPATTDSQNGFALNSPSQNAGNLAVQRVLNAYGTSSDSTVNPATTAAPITHKSLCTSGRPLDHATRALFEPRFGADLNGVRLHTDNQAAQAALDIHAKAFTHGQDIYFGRGLYQPGTQAGDKLLAHELTHTVQQKNGAGVQSSGLISHRDDPAEREAQAMSDNFVRARETSECERKEARSASGLPAIQRQSTSAIQRDDDETLAESLVKAGFNQPHAVGHAGFGNQPHAIGQAGFGNQPHAVGQAGFGNQPHAVGQAGFGNQPHAVGQPGAAGVAPAAAPDLTNFDISSEPADNLERFKRIWWSAGETAFENYAYELLKRMSRSGGLVSMDQFVDRFWDYIWRQTGGRVTNDPTLQTMVWIGHSVMSQEKRIKEEIEKAKNFIPFFEEEARKYTRNALNNSEKRVTRELKHYLGSSWFFQFFSGFDDDTEEESRSEEEDKASRRGLGIAAAGLARRRNAVIKANANYRNMVRGWGHHSPYSEMKPVEDALEQAKRAYEVFRLQVISRFPILEEISSREIDPYDEDAEPDDGQGEQLNMLAKMAQGDDSEEAVHFIVHTVLEKLHDINKSRKDIEPGGDINIWRVPEIVQATRVLIGVASGTFEGELVDKKFEDENRPRNESESLLSKILLYGGLVLAPFTDFLSLVPYGIYEAGKVGFAIHEHIKEYMTAKALHNTDFGAAALSAEDPSLFWLAGDILNAGLAIMDLAPLAGPALRIFRRLAPLARLAREVRAGEEALNMLRNGAEEVASQQLGAGAENAGKALAEKVVEDARAARSGEMAGMTADEAKMLEQADAQVAAAAGKRDTPDIASAIEEEMGTVSQPEPLYRIEDVKLPEPAPETFEEALDRVGEVPSSRLNELKAEYQAYKSAWKPTRRSRRMLSEYEYTRYRYGRETGRYVQPFKPLEPRFAGEVGRLAEGSWAKVVETPRNPGVTQGGRFQTPWANVEPDFIPAVDASGGTQFARNGQFASRNNLPGIEDALLVADSKYFGVFSDAVKSIDITDQIRGMIWLAQFTKSRTFVALARPGQQLAKGILDFAKIYEVNVEIRATAVVR